MNIHHDSTIRIAKGWQTVLRVDIDGEETGVVIRHDAPTSRVISHPMDVIHDAIERETIIDRREIIDEETARKIEDSLLEWISNTHGTQYRYLRWHEETMLGFASKADAEAFDATRREKAEQAPVKKKRIMLG
jgi:hypothetical protein